MAELEDFESPRRWTFAAQDLLAANYLGLGRVNEMDMLVALTSASGFRKVLRHEQELSKNSRFDLGSVHPKDRCRWPTIRSRVNGAAGIAD